jgi:hypothetical protein
MAGSKARVPPRWFVVSAWHVHRWLVRATDRGLWPLWRRWHEFDKNLDGYAARRPRETAVVVLEPRPTAG